MLGVLQQILNYPLEQLSLSRDRRHLLVLLFERDGGGDKLILTAGSWAGLGLAEGFEILKAGSYDYRMGGFVKHFQSGELTLHTDFFYQEDDSQCNLSILRDHLG